MENKINGVIPPKPNDENNLGDWIIAFDELVRILRRDCPWDKKQTHESIAPLIIEEAYEVIDAIHDKNDYEFSKELGDVLLHIVMHSVLAEERGAFDLKDVISRIQTKLISRHPHVFGDTIAENETQVMQNWEQLKKKEGKKTVLEGIPNALPSLLRAERIQHKVSRVGFDWDNKEDVWNKVKEEIIEFSDAKNRDNTKDKEEEFGDLLFALVNASRHEGIVAEDALQRANKKFISRFNFIEEKAKERGKELNTMSLSEMDELWDLAKKEEKK